MIVWFTVAIFVVKLNCKSIAYCGRANAGCGVAVGAGVSVGNAVSVGGAIVADGSVVSVGTTGKAVGAAHETIRRIQIIENKNLGVLFVCMELILLDLELSLNLVSCHPERSEGSLRQS